MVRPAGFGPRAKTWCTRWHSILRDGCWPERETAAIFLPSPAKIDFTDLLKASATQVTAFAKAPGGGLYVSTSNLGKVFLLGGRCGVRGQLTKAMFSTPRSSPAGDARSFAGRAGRAVCPQRQRGQSRPQLESVEAGRSAERRGIECASGALRAVEGRAACWVLPRPAWTACLLNYLPKNVAPDFDDVTVQVGVRYQPLPKPSIVPDTSGTAAGSQPTIRCAAAQHARRRFHRREVDGAR